MLDRFSINLEEASALIISALAALGLTQKTIRAYLWRHVVKFWEQRKRMDRMLKTQTVIMDTLDDIKGFMYEQNRRQELDFRMHSLPAFECDQNGRNHRVSDAYLEMLGLRRETDLQRMDWKQFIHPEDADSYFTNFIDAASEQSDFSASIRMLDAERMEIGSQHVRIFCVTPSLFVGYIKPAAKNAA